MSGNFVQRGDFAILRKHARAEAALCGGADLVLELPLPWALSSAEGFARGAVGLLGASGVITHLSFGSESGDISALEKCARILLRPEMEPLIRENLAKGISYARARQLAADELVGETLTELSTPNNILGIEYIKAIYDQRLAIQPVTIKRIGAGHDRNEASDIPSASSLRAMLHDGQSIASRLPAAAAEVFSREISCGRGPVMSGALDSAMCSRLRMLPQSAFEELPDAAEGLGTRLFRACHQACDIDAAVAAAATKRYAVSRLRRMIMCACLGIKSGMNDELPPYLRVLAANERGCSIIKMMQQRSKLPIVTKPGEINRLGTEAKQCFSLESAATDLFVLGFEAREERSGDRDWRVSPFIMK